MADVHTDYEALLAELRQVVDRLQTGSLPLPEAMALYRRGQELHSACTAYLERVQLEVVQLQPDGSQAPLPG